MGLVDTVTGAVRGTLLAVAAFSLAGCATSSLDELSSTTPQGSSFTQELFKNYSFLATSFAGAPPVNEDEDAGFLDFGGNDEDLSALADAFATKALIAARGVEVAPEPGRDGASTAARDRLLRDLADGKDRFPSDAARAQTDFDCWMLNSSVASQQAASAQCATSFSVSIARLESDLRPPPPPAPPPAAAPADFTVYFDFDSWTLTGEQLTVLQQAIAAARAGRQSRIAIVGHTDTSGSAAYNQALSVKRANVVMEALVDMGARREAVSASGVGETDLAVSTPDGVREAKNRRSVITLLP